MQSGLGVNFLFWPGELGKWPANFSANVDGEFSREIFGFVFPGFQVPPKKSRPELSAFLSNFTFSNPKFFHADFLLTAGDQKM